MFAWDLRKTVGAVAMALLVFGACYGAAAWFGHAAAVATVWPANAIALAFALVVGRTRGAIGVFIALAGLAMALANVAVGRPWLTTMGFPVANMVEIALAAWFMRDVRMPMSSTSDLRQFFLGAVVAGPLASVLLAGPLIALAFGLSDGTLLKSASAWLFSDMMGMAIVAPVTMKLLLLRGHTWWRALSGPAVIGGIAFLMCFQRVVPLTFIAFPMVAAAVLRDRERGAALGVGAVTTAILIAATQGAGPIASMARIGLDPVHGMQIFLAALVLTVYPIAALVRRLDAYAAQAELARVAAVADSAAKSRVMGQVGEELRSPLTGVVTVAEMLKSGRLGELNDRQRGLLVRIAESGAAIEALSREMVSLADGGERAMRGAPFAEIVQGAVAGAVFRAHRRKIEIRLSPLEPTWLVPMDPERLNRLVADSLASALDAAPADSVIQVRASLDDPGHVSLTIDDADEKTFAERQARCAVLRLVTPASDGWAYDRAELRRAGGDLIFRRGDLGGGQLILRLPLLPDDPAARVA